MEETGLDMNTRLVTLVVKSIFRGKLSHKLRLWSLQRGIEQV